jgi:CRP/FNR family cyclic AMP-dependent transcriptional regulator
LLLVLESGHITVIKQWEDRQYHLAELHEGICFGEMALMASYPCSAYIIALEDSIALVITVSTLLELCENDLTDFSSLQMNLGREVSHRLREPEGLFQFRLHSNLAAREFGGQTAIATEA